MGEHLFTNYLSIARGRLGSKVYWVWVLHTGIDGLGGLFWSILNNANVFLHHFRFLSPSIFLSVLSINAYWRGDVSCNGRMLWRSHTRCGDHS